MVEPRRCGGMAAAFLIPEIVQPGLSHLSAQTKALRKVKDVKDVKASTISTQSSQSHLFASSIAIVSFAGIRRKRFRVSKEATSEGLETAKEENNNEYAYKMVKIAAIVTVLPFLFCIGNFFYDPALSDFSVEYGPHLAHPALRTTSVVQAILVFSAVLWREKYRSDPIDRLFAWLFVPEAATHILLHWFSHYHAFANFAFAYAFSAGIALPGFLSLLCYVPKEKKQTSMVVSCLVHDYSDTHCCRPHQHGWTSQDAFEFCKYQHCLDHYAFLLWNSKALEGCSKSSGGAGYVDNLLPGGHGNHGPYYWSFKLKAL